MGNKIRCMLLAICVLPSACTVTPQSPSNEEMAGLELFLRSASAGLLASADPSWGLLVKIYNFNGENSELHWNSPPNEYSKLKRMLQCVRSEAAPQIRFAQPENYANGLFIREKVDRCQISQGIPSPIEQNVGNADTYELKIRHHAKSMSGTFPSDTLGATRTLSKVGVDGKTVQVDVLRCSTEAGREGIVRRVEPTGLKKSVESASLAPFVSRIELCLQQAGYTTKL